MKVIRMPRYPNLYLIGAPKAGTTFLHAQFSQSQNIFCAGNKEPFFFIREGMEHVLHGPKRKKLPLLAEARDKNAYLEMYNNWGEEQYAVDSSTYYLSYPGTAERIAKANPDAKIIAILREPLSRAYSHYLMELRDGWFDHNLELAIKQEEEEIKTPELPWGGHYCIIRQSLYLEGLKSYYEHFGQGNLRVYLFEDIVKNPEKVLSDISEFLDIEPITLKKADKSKNSYAADRLPLITRAINAYRASPVRNVINALTPRKARDFVRTRYDKLRLKNQKKPEMSDQEKVLLEEKLGNDYEKSLVFVREKGLLFEG